MNPRFNVCAKLTVGCHIDPLQNAADPNQNPTCDSFLRLISGLNFDWIVFYNICPNVTPNISPNPVMA